MVVAIATPGASAARVRSWGARQICSTQDHLSGGGCLVVRCGADLVVGPAGLLTAQGGDGGGAGGSGTSLRPAISAALSRSADVVAAPLASAARSTRLA